MTQYKNTPGGFTPVRKRLINRAIPVSLIAIAGGSIISSFEEENPVNHWYVLTIAAFFLSGIMIYSINRAIKIQRDIYNSYLLTIDADNLSRRQSGLAPLTIPFNEITEITEDEYGLLVKGSIKQRQLVIPVSVENYAAIREQLQSASPLSLAGPKTLLQKNQLPVALVSVGLMAVTYISSNKTVIIVSGTVLIILMAASLYQVQASALVDKHTRLQSWWILIVIVSTIAVIYYKVFPF